MSRGLELQGGRVKKTPPQTSLICWLFDLLRLGAEASKSSLEASTGVDDREISSARIWAGLLVGIWNRLPVEVLGVQSCGVDEAAADARRSSDGELSYSVTLLHGMNMLACGRDRTRHGSGG